MAQTVCVTLSLLDRTDTVGLYMAPPTQAVVLSIDEKSQIQALDRTQPGLPIKPGRCGTMTHDYKRHGTTTLFAALNILNDTVIGRCMQQHRHEAFTRFPNDVERAVPVGKLIEAVVDNYATHKHPTVTAWLERYLRWTFHFTPTSGSWLNAVENFFSVLTRKRIRRGSFHSLVDLQAAIKRYLTEHNAKPKPFVWTASAASILAKLDRLPPPSV
jgi:transposase